MEEEWRGLYAVGWPPQATTSWQLDTAPSNCPLAVVLNPKEVALDYPQAAPSWQLAPPQVGGFWATPRRCPLAPSLVAL